MYANVVLCRIVSYCVILCHSVSLFPLDSGLPPVSARSAHSAPSAHSAQFALSALYAQSVPSPSAETVPPAQPTSQLLLPPPLAHPASTKPKTWETMETVKRVRSRSETQWNTESSAAKALQALKAQPGRPDGLYCTPSMQRAHTEFWQPRHLGHCGHGSDQSFPIFCWDLVSHGFNSEIFRIYRVSCWAKCQSLRPKHSAIQCYRAQHLHWMDTLLWNTSESYAFICIEFLVSSFSGTNKIQSNLASKIIKNHQRSSKYITIADLQIWQSSLHVATLTQSVRMGLRCLHPPAGGGSTCTWCTSKNGKQCICAYVENSGNTNWARRALVELW